MSKTTVYLRISTDKQDEASQMQIIKAKYPSADFDFSWVSDTASGGTAWQSRAIAGVLEKSVKGDRIIVSEISRIARSTVGILSFLEAAAEKGVTVDAVNTGITLDGSLASTIVVTILAMVAQIERSLLKERTKAALDARKARGLPVGRQVGAVGKKNKLNGRMAEIQPLLDAKVSMTAIARVLKVSRQTLYTFLEEQEKA
jgi:DNA invertase Pin-like site-specific DNA recombinase